eukprot:ANDGO_06961.mRNA.1 hypothetical protein
MSNRNSNNNSDRSRNSRITDSDGKSGDFFSSKRQSLGTQVSNLLRKAQESADAGNPDDGLEIARHAVQIARSVHQSETHADVVYARSIVALMLQDMGKLKDAVRELRNIPLNAQSAEVHFQLGNIHASLNEFANAKSAFSAALKLAEPGFAKATILLNKALLLAKSNLHEEAIADFNAANRAALEVLGAQPEKLEMQKLVAFNLGRCYASLGKNSDALFHFEKTLTLMGKEDLMDATQNDVRLAMAAVHVADQDWRNAERMYVRVKDFVHHQFGRDSKQAADVYDALGVCYWRLRKLKSSLIYFDRACKISGSAKASKRVDIVQSVISQYHQLATSSVRRERSSPSLRESVLRSQLQQSPHKSNSPNSPFSSPVPTTRLERTNSVRSIASEATWDLPDNADLDDSFFEVESIAL